jgi:hypothetical protein
VQVITKGGVGEARIAILSRRMVMMLLRNDAYFYLIVMSFDRNDDADMLYEGFFCPRYVGTGKVKV